LNAWFNGKSSTGDVHTIIPPAIVLENFKRPVPVLPEVITTSIVAPAIKSQIKFMAPNVVREEHDVIEELPPTQMEISTQVTGTASVENESGISTIGIIENQDAQIEPESTNDDVVVFNSYAVQQQAEFPDGMAAMYKFLSKELKYTEKALEAGLSGTVYIQFIVSKSGAIENAQVLRGINRDLDREALRVVNLMPAWKPGKHNGKPVAVYFTLPIKFQLLK
jgi:protein TonB